MLTELELSKLVKRQELHKLELQIKGTEEHLKALEAELELFKQSKAMGDRNKQDTANFAAIKLKRLQECSFPKDSKEWAALAAGAQRAQDLVWIAENQYLESHQNYQGCLEEQNQHTEALKKLKEAYQQNRITYVNLCYDIAQSEARVHSTKPLSAEEQHEFLQTKMLPPNFSR